MAIEKTLNTRIQLKYDSLANWNSNSGVILKKGEVAFCAIESGSAVNGDLSRPQILFKVGDGKSTFAVLPWASATAADVHAWAKQANLPVVKEGDGNVVTGISWDAENKAIKYTTDMMATATEFAALEKDLEELTEKVNAMYTNAKIDELVADAKKAGTDAAAALESYETTNDARVKAVEDDIAEITDADNGILAKAKEYALGLDTEMDKRVDVLEAIDHTKYAVKTEVAATYETKADASAYQTSNDARVLAVEGDVAENTAAIAAINNSENGILKQAQDYADGLNTAMGQRVTNLSDDVVHNNTFAAFKTSNTAAIKTAADTAEENAKKYADDLKDEILGEGIKDTFDTLVEIQTWIEGAGVNATELTEAIAAEAKLRADEDTRLDGEISKEVTRAKAAEKALAGDIAEIVAGTTPVTNATNAVNATNDANGNNIASTYETKTDAASKLTEAKGYTDTAKAAAIKHADDEISALRTELEAADDAIEDRLAALEDDFSNGIANEAAKVSNALTVTMEDSTVKTFDGSEAVAISLTNLATKAYADQAESDAIASAKTYTDAAVKAEKERAEEAESALSGRVSTLESNHIKTVTAGTGLKVTPSTNAAEIAFDDSVVFVFNCGSATELA